MGTTFIIRKYFLKRFIIVKNFTLSLFSTPFPRLLRTYYEVIRPVPPLSQFPISVITAVIRVSKTYIKYLCSKWCGSRSRVILDWTNWWMNCRIFEWITLRNWIVFDFRVSWNKQQFHVWNNTSGNLNNFGNAVTSAINSLSCLRRLRPISFVLEILYLCDDLGISSSPNRFGILSKTKCGGTLNRLIVSPFRSI